MANPLGPNFLNYKNCSSLFSRRNLLRHFLPFSNWTTIEV